MITDAFLFGKNTCLRVFKIEYCFSLLPYNFQMPMHNKKCPQCRLSNSRGAKSCVKCLYKFNEVESRKPQKTILQKIIKRGLICLAVVIFALTGFYLSLVFSAEPLKSEEYAQIYDAIDILEQKGFDKEVFMLRYLTVYRGTDHWLNASVAKEGAYAATNYPFEIMTIYPDFFAYTKDDTERAAILLHEAKHLEGHDEPVAYEFVWKNKKRIGWTKENYMDSVVWLNVRKQTREFAPNLFVCEFNEYEDCTQ